MHEFTSGCMGFVLAKNIGIKFRNENDPALQVTDIAINNRKYTNVDITGTTGLDRTKTLVFSEARMADLIMAPHFTKLVSACSNEHSPRAAVTIVNIRGSGQRKCLTNYSNLLQLSL